MITNSFGISITSLLQRCRARARRQLEESRHAVGMVALGLGIFWDLLGESRCTITTSFLCTTNTTNKHCSLARYRWLERWSIETEDA